MTEQRSSYNNYEDTTLRDEDNLIGLRGMINVSSVYCLNYGVQIVGVVTGAVESCKSRLARILIPGRK